jgi:hypothetical protein
MRLQHSPEFTARHPVRPLADYPADIQRAFGYTPKRAAATRDGRLT